MVEKKDSQKSAADSLTAQEAKLSMRQQSVDKKTVAVEKKERALKEKERALDKRTGHVDAFNAKIVKQERVVRRKENEIIFRDTMRTTIYGALTFVIGLFWRDLIVEFNNFFLPEEYGFAVQAFITIFSTVVVVLLVIFATKQKNKHALLLENEQKKLDALKMKSAEHK